MAAAGWSRACSGPAMTISIGLSWPGAAPGATSGPPNVDSSPQRIEAAFMVGSLARSLVVGGRERQREGRGVHVRIDVGATAGLVGVLDVFHRPGVAESPRDSHAPIGAAP